MHVNVDSMRKQFRWKGYVKILVNGNGQHERVWSNAQTGKSGTRRNTLMKEVIKQNSDEQRKSEGAYGGNAYIKC